MNKSHKDILCKIEFQPAIILEDLCKIIKCNPLKAIIESKNKWTKTLSFYLPNFSFLFTVFLNVNELASLIITHCTTVNINKYYNYFLIFICLTSKITKDHTMLIMQAVVKRPNLNWYQSLMFKYIWFKCLMFTEIDKDISWNTIILWP